MREQRKMGHEGMDSMEHNREGAERQPTVGMEHTSHGGHEAMNHGGGGHMMMHMGNLKQKFFICLVLAIPVLLLSPMMGLELPFQLSFPGSQWVVLVLATMLYFYGGMPFLQGTWQELKSKSPAMMTLISLGITVAYFYSLYAFVNNNLLHSGHHVMDFFWELATLIVIMLLGHWIEMKAVAGAGSALQKMAELLPGEAALLEEDGTVKSIPLRELQEGQWVLVRAGEKVPADGVIEKGATSVNEAMVTGEAKAVAKDVGDKVVGGSVNGAGGIEVKVTGTGESGYLAQVMQLVGSAQREKSRAEGLSDKVAKWLFYVAAAAGILAFIIWLVITQSIDAALARMVTVLVIACPHALGLAIPLVVARSTALGAKNGLLVRNRQALEIAPKVDVMMMDKTGTLTEGRFTLKKVEAARGMEENGVLAIMAALEQNSTHPLAAGIVKEAQERGIGLPDISEVQNLPGIGLEGCLANGAKALIASPSYLDKHQLAYDKAAFEQQAGEGDTVSFLLLDDRVAGWVAQGDTIKPQAAAMVRALKARNIRPVMLTGDNPASARGVAQKLGIEAFEAGLLPQDKERLVRETKNQGDVVMMVGDGVNDAPSLARADIGVAIGAGTDVAIDSADVVLVKSDPADILHFLVLAKNTNRKMVQNLWWGAGYNIVAIPLAAGVLAPVGILLSPAVGAVLMSLSTVIVAINALTLRIK